MWSPIDLKHTRLTVLRIGLSGLLLGAEVGYDQPHLTANPERHSELRMQGAAGVAGASFYVLISSSMSPGCWEQNRHRPSSPTLKTPQTPIDIGVYVYTYTHT